jgi:hypothetical protein
MSNGKTPDYGTQENYTLTADSVMKYTQKIDIIDFLWANGLNSRFPHVLGRHEQAT